MPLNFRVTLSVVPEDLNAVDVSLISLGQVLGVVDAVVVVAFRVQHVVADERTGRDLPADDRHLCGASEVDDHLGVDLPAVFEGSKKLLPCPPRSGPACPSGSCRNMNLCSRLAVENIRLAFLMLGDDLAQLTEEQVCGVTVHTHEMGRGPGSGPTTTRLSSVRFWRGVNLR